MPESARRPPVPSHSGTEAPTQGTSFLRLCDSHVMRFTTLWHATAEDGWEATFGGSSGLRVWSGAQSVSEASGVDEGSGDVVGEVAEALGDAS